MRCSELLRASLSLGFFYRSKLANLVGDERRTKRASLQS